MSYLESNLKTELRDVIRAAGCCCEEGTRDWETGIGARLLKRVEFSETGCWNWTGATDRHGYGQIRIYYRLFNAYRISYAEWIGDVPMSLELDHLCRNPLCINPHHLEAVTHQENIARGMAAKVRERASCKRGHPYTADNTGFRTQGKYTFRFCKKCHRLTSTSGRRRRKGSEAS